MRGTRSILATTVIPVALAVGLGTVAVRAQDADNVVPETVELPHDIPEDVASGTLDTPLGPARWVHLQGGAADLPSLIRPVPVPGGYVSLDVGGRAHGPCPVGEVCQFGAARILVCAPDGAFIRAIDIPDRDVTNVGFGPDESSLFVTAVTDSWTAPYPGLVYRLDNPMVLPPHGRQ